MSETGYPLPCLEKPFLHNSPSFEKLFCFRLQGLYFEIDDDQFRSRYGCDPGLDNEFIQFLCLQGIVDRKKKVTLFRAILGLNYCKGEALFPVIAEGRRNGLELPTAIWLLPVISLTDEAHKEKTRLEKKRETEFLLI